MRLLLCMLFSLFLISMNAPSVHASESTITSDELESLSSSFSDLRNALTRLANELERRQRLLEDSDQTLRRLNNELVMLKRANESLENELTQTENELSSARSEQQRLENELSQLSERLQDSESSRTSLLSRLNQIEQQSEMLSTQLSEVKQSYDEYASEAAAQIETLREERDSESRRADTERRTGRIEGAVAGTAVGILGIVLFSILF